MSSSPFNWDQCLQYTAVSDIGMRRAKNQDSHVEVLADDIEMWYRNGHLFVVADGMGAHAAGELASKQAVEGIAHLYHKYGELSSPEAILQAIRETNSEIHRRGRANAEFYNMGTTCSSLLLLAQGALVAHVGDSRVYRWRDNELQQLTFDHSLVWEMREARQLSGGRDDSATYIPKNVITRSLGPQPTVQVDLEGPYQIKEGDRFLLCSDGLTGKVDDPEIGAIIGALPPREAAQMLVDLANLRGGPDNITAIVIQAVGPEITTQHANATPLTVGDKSQLKKKVHPILWVVIVAATLMGLAMLLMHQVAFALVALIVGVVASSIAVLQKFGQSMGTSLTGANRLGKGPYETAKCPVDSKFLDGLDTTIEMAKQRLNDDPRGEEGARTAQVQRARELLKEGKSQQVMRNYARSLSDLFAAVRDQEARRSSDSSIELS